MQHKKTAQPIERILSIFNELYSLKKLYVKDLAYIYNVSDKTITRDFAKIDKIVPLSRKQGVYWIEPTTLKTSQKLPTKLLQSFANNANIEIDCIANHSENISIITFAIAYNSIDKDIAESIIKSIERSKKCQFKYTNNKLQTSIKMVSPIKLLTEKGKWYLVAKDSKDDTIKNYDFFKIKDFKITQNNSDITTQDLDYAKKISSVWSSHKQEPFEVKLYVDRYAKHYIDEVPLHQSQKLYTPFDDGSAEYIYTITNTMELLPKIKEWIPHIHILSPMSLKDGLKKDILGYLKDYDEYK
jgi:predicted DNA-binding transcriptional regulator YafY